MFCHRAEIALKLQQHKHVFDSLQVFQVFVFKQQTLHYSQIALRWPCSQVDIIQQTGETLCNMQSNHVNQVKHNAIQYKSQNEQKVHL